MLNLRTPNLHLFHVVWYLQPSQFPAPLNNEEFIGDRFIEDIMDGRSSLSLIVQDIKIPPVTTHVVGQDVAVRLDVLTTEDMAKDLIELGYKVTPDKPDEMSTLWDDEPDGMTWRDLMTLINGHMRPTGPELDKQVRLTDDGDPHAPWFQLTGIKKDDDGWFIAIEEIQP